MATYDQQQTDGTPDYEAQIRQRILAQMSPDPTSGGNDTVASTPSPDFAAHNGEAAVQAVGTPATPAAGSVSQSQAGFAPVSGADLQVRQAPIDSTQFYNGNTGASARYDAGSGMYIDASGAQIRPDAIRTSNPSAFAGQPSAPAAAASSGSPRINGGTSGWQDQIRALLMQRLQAAQQPVDPNSPEIAASVGAAKDQLTRQSEQERNALAERLYGQGGGGLNTNAITQQIQQSNERQGTQLGSLKATLLMNAYNQKHSELQNDLQLAVQSNDLESARAIQMEIAQLQAAVQREGLGVNLAEFTGQLNQNATLAGLRG